MTTRSLCVRGPCALHVVSPLLVRADCLLSMAADTDILYVSASARDGVLRDFPLDAPLALTCVAAGGGARVCLEARAALSARLAVSAQDGAVIELPGAEPPFDHLVAVAAAGSRVTAATRATCAVLDAEAAAGAAVDSLFVCDAVRAVGAGCVRVSVARATTIAGAVVVDDVAMWPPLRAPARSFGADVCALCLERRPQLQCAPCGHEAVCVACWATARRFAVAAACPLCRAGVKGLVRLKVA